MRTPRHLAGLDHVPRTFLVVAMVMLFALALAPACRPARELVMVVTPGVPSSSGCVEGATACVAGVPVRCSDSGRWWPALPRRADGTQRVCPSGQACAAPTASEPVHHCAPVDDGGAP